MDSISKDIGEKLKAIRKEMNLSLDTAAKLTGVSKAMLGQIERGESTPTVLTLWKISTGLKVSFSHLISSSNAESTIVNVDEIEPIQESEDGMFLYNIFPFDPVSGFDYYKIIIEPGGRHESIPHPNVEKEYIVVLEGSLEMTVNDSVFTINKGQAFSFKGNASHCYANPFEQPVLFHNVLKYK